ncbi:MAG: hypothetical protein ACLGHX_14885 [Acidimicrobiia bacterium]
MTTASGSLRKTNHPLAKEEPGAAVRPSAGPRPQIRVRPLGQPEIGFSPSSPYVLRFWTQAIGAAPTEELLRLCTAGKRRRKVLRPKFLNVLIESGVIEMRDGAIHAPFPVPALPPHLSARLSATERLVHDRWLRLVRRRAQTAARRES